MTSTELVDLAYGDCASRAAEGYARMKNGEALDSEIRNAMLDDLTNLRLKIYLRHCERNVLAAKGLTKDEIDNRMNGPERLDKKFSSSIDAMEQAVRNYSELNHPR